MNLKCHKFVPEADNQTVVANQKSVPVRGECLTFVCSGLQGPSACTLGFVENHCQYDAVNSVTRDQ